MPFSGGQPQLQAPSPVEWFEGDEQRFLNKISVGDDCWEWQANVLSGGYGQCSIGKRKHLAHRAMYMLMVGAIPKGLQLDHLCRNRKCVRPSHLEPVTARENTMRGNTIPAANARKTHCPQGHPYDEANTMLIKGRHRYCRTCSRARWHRWNDARKAA